MGSVRAYRRSLFRATPVVSAVRDFQCPDDRARLVERLFEFALGHGIRYDPGACLNIGMSSFGHERAQPDTGIQIAREIQIKNRASIDPAAGRLELIDNLHGSDLGRT